MEWCWRVTSNLVNAADPAHCLIDVSTPEGQASGLDRNSVVSWINLAVIPPRNFDRKIGGVPEATMQRIDQCLKRALGIA